jgi:hypothetical protein
LESRRPRGRVPSTARGECIPHLLAALEGGPHSVLPERELTDEQGTARRLRLAEPGSHCREIGSRGAGAPLSDLELSESARWRRTCASLSASKRPRQAASAPKARRRSFCFSSPRSPRPLVACGPNFHDAIGAIGEGCGQCRIVGFCGLAEIVENAPMKSSLEPTLPGRGSQAVDARNRCAIPELGRQHEKGPIPPDVQLDVVFSSGIATSEIGRLVQFITSPAAQAFLRARDLTRSNFGGAIGRYHNSALQTRSPAPAGR